MLKGIRGKTLEYRPSQNVSGAPKYPRRIGPVRKFQKTDKHDSNTPETACFRRKRLTGLPVLERQLILTEPTCMQDEGTDSVGSFGFLYSVWSIYLCMESHARGVHGESPVMFGGYTRTDASGAYIVGPRSVLRGNSEGLHLPPTLGNQDAIVVLLPGWSIEDDDH